MSEESRILLENQTIYIRKNTHEQPKRCTIVNVFSKDEESILYNAMLDGVPGFLREFYPQYKTAYSLTRINGNYLKVDPERSTVEEKEKFNTDIKEFTDRFARYLESLDEYKEDPLKPSKESYSSILLTYEPLSIPQIYESDNEDATQYIWTERKSFGQTLTDYCRMLSDEDLILPEDKWSLLLIALREITAYVNAFLKIGPYHLDFNGENFHVLTGENNTEKIHSSDSSPELALLALKQNNINFLKVSDHQSYVEDYFDYIHDILFKTLGIRSKKNSDDPLDFEITPYGFGKELFRQPNPYFGMSLLSILQALSQKEDIESLLNELTSQSEFYLQGRSNSELYDYLSDFKDFSYRRDVVLNGLLQYPIGKLIQKDQKDINILVLGGGVFGRVFLDQVLPTSQIIGKKLNIYIYDNNNVSEKFLKERPELIQFVNVSIDGEEISQIEEKRSPLANLFFYRPDQNNLPLDQIATIDRLFKDKLFDYGFVSLGNDDVNKEVSKELNSILRKTIPILYPTGKRFESVEEAPEVHLENGIPLEIRRLSSINNPVILKLAFNFMIIEKDRFNTDIRHLRQITENSITYEDKVTNSPVIDIVALLNNLYALGVLKENIATENIEKADRLLKESAKRFYDDFINIQGQPEAFKFIEIFHYISVLKSLVRGIRRIDLKNSSFEDNPEFLEEIFSRKKIPELVWIDKDNKFSDEDKRQILNGTIDLTDNKFEAYDPLDQVSLYESFRFNEYRRKVLQRVDNPIIAQINALERIIEDYYHISDISKDKLDRLLMQLKKLEFGFKNISSGNTHYAQRFDGILYSFGDELSNTDGHFIFTQELKDRFIEITSEAILFVNGSYITDYREQYRSLFENIPFILSNQDEAVLISFLNINEKNNKPNKLFPFVASACLILPKQIDYYYVFEKHSSLDELQKQFRLILNFLRARKVGENVNLKILYPKPEREDELQDYLEAFEHLKTEMEQEYGEFLSLESIVEPKEKIKDALTDKLSVYQNHGFAAYVDLSSPVFVDQTVQANFIKSIVEEIKIPSFQFDSRYMKFFNNQSCSFLNYIDTSRFYLRIQELFILGNRENGVLNLPEFSEEYQTLWEIYNGSYLNGKDDNKKKRNGVKTWNMLSEVINKTNQKKEQKQSYIGSFIPNTDFQKEKDILEKDYYLPDYSFNTVSYLVNLLKNNEVLDTKSNIVLDINGTCKAILRFHKKNKQAIDQLFSNPTHLTEKRMFDYYFEPSKDGMRKLKLKFADLNSYQIIIGAKKVKNTPSHEELEKINEDYLKSGALNRKKLLEELQKNGFITHLKFRQYYKKNQHKVYTSATFFYSSKRVKDILESSGKIFEIYVFYLLLEDGYFDDVINGYEILFDMPGNKESEIDLILTKGFRSYVIECKATSQLSRKYYLSLSSLGEAYGINHNNILLHYDFTNNQDSFDDIHEFGEQLNSQTITLSDKVSDLPEKLRKIDEFILEG